MDDLRYAGDLGAHFDSILIYGTRFEDEGYGLCGVKENNSV